MNTEGSSLNSGQESDAGRGDGSSSSQSKRPKGSKKRASRAGQRFVSSLSDAQLERKRANDREAQRAIRLRTQETIRGLQQSNEELRSNADASARRIAELEYENAYLRNVRPILTPSAANVDGTGSPLSQPGSQLESYPASPSGSSAQYMGSTTSRRGSLNASHSSSRSEQSSWHQGLPLSSGLGSTASAGGMDWQQQEGYSPDMRRYQEPTAAAEPPGTYQIAQNQWSNEHSAYPHSVAHQGRPDWHPTQLQQQPGPYISREQSVHDSAGPTYHRSYQQPPLPFQGDLHGGRGEYRHTLGTLPQTLQHQQGHVGFPPPPPTTVAPMPLSSPAFGTIPAGPPYSYQQPPPASPYRDPSGDKPRSHRPR